MVDLASLITPRFLLPYEINQSEIEEICALKNQSWPHSMESQLDWWNKNTAVNDLLVTLVCEYSILAFLRLRSRIILVNGAHLEALCVTEVCVNQSQRKSGLGRQLMSVATNCINQTSSSLGYLLCRDVHEQFYNSCGWHRVEAPLQIQSSIGREFRLLTENERCMTFDTKRLLNGQIVLIGDVF